MTKKKAPPKSATDATDDAPDPWETLAEYIADAVGEDPQALLYIERRIKETGDYAGVTRMQPHDFDPHEIHRHYGGGEFRARLKRRNGQWIAGSTRFFLEGPPKFPEHETPAEAKPAEPKESGTDRMMALMMGMMGEIVKAVATRPEPRDQGPQMAELFRVLADNQKSAQEASKAATKELVELVGLREKLDKRGPDPIEILKMGMEMARENAGGGNDYLTAAGPAFEALAKFLTRDGAVPGAPGGQPPSPNPGAPEGAQAATPARYNPLRAAVEMLLPVAQSGTERYDALAELTDEQTPGLADALLAGVESAGSIQQFVDAVARFDPRVSEHRPFFVSFVQAFVGLYSGDDDDSEDSTEKHHERPGDGGRPGAQENTDASGPGAPSGDTGAGPDASE